MVTTNRIPFIPASHANLQQYGHVFCIGFDPATADLHPFLYHQLAMLPRETFLTQWYRTVIEATHRNCKTIKLQSAFFEACGVEGFTALRNVIQDAKQRGLYVILDAKRGDISSTMHGYGQAAFDALDADALTILPWMGVDVIAALLPWMKRERAVYTVWLSSNKAGRDLQTSHTHPEKTLAKQVFDIWEGWARKEGVANQCGYVVGATDLPPWVHELLENRSHALLMPGLGAQGGKITPQLKSLVNKHPASLLPLSRGILTPGTNEPITSWDDYGAGVDARLRGFIQMWKAAPDELV